MKRFISSITIIMLFIGMMNVTAYAGQSSVLFCESFSEYEEGANIPYKLKLGGTDENNRISIKDFVGGGVLNIISEQKGNPSVGFSADKNVKQFVLNFKISIVEINSDIELFAEDAKGNRLNILTFKTNFDIKAADGITQSIIGTFKKSELLDINCVFNFKQLCYSVYINDSEAAENLIFPQFTFNSNEKWADGGIDRFLIDTDNKSGERTEFNLPGITVYRAKKVLTDEEIAGLDKKESVINVSEIPDVTVFANADFNDLNDGDTNIGIGVTNKNNFINAAEFPDEDNKSVQIRAVTQDDCYVMTSFDSTMKKPFVCEFKVYFHDLNSRCTFTLRDPKPIFHDIIGFSAGGALKGVDGKNITSYAAGKWYKFAVAIDPAEKYYSVFLDGEKIIDHMQFNDMSGSGIGLLRFHVYPSADRESEINIDDWKVYSGTEILSEDIINSISGADASYFTDMQKMYDLFSGKLAVAVGGDSFYVNGKKQALAAMDGSVCSYKQNETLMLPIREVAKALGADIEWDESSSAVKCTLSDRLFILHDGDEYKNAEICIKEDIMFVPIDLICDMTGASKKVYSDSLYVLDFGGENADIEKAYTDEMRRYLTYDRPSAQKIMDLLAAKSPDKAHPRIMVNEEGFEGIKNKVENDEFLCEIYEKVIKSADSYIDAPMLTYNSGSNSANLETSRQMLSRALSLGFVYNMTGEKKYAEALWKNLYHAGNYPDFNPAHYLDVGEMSMAFAIGYDWLYDYWTDQQRSFLEQVIVEKSLKPTIKEYESYTQNGFFINAKTNWNVVCNGGVACAALAIMEEAPDSACKAVSYALHSLEYMMESFAPDGAWAEGVTYWQYTVTYFTYFLSSLQKSLGTTFGFLEAEGVANTGYYLLHSTGPKGSFNYADAGAAYYSAPEIFWLSDILNNPQLTAMIRYHMTMYKLSGGVTTLLWYNPEMFEKAKQSSYSLGAVFHGIELSAIRSKFDDQSALYAAMIGGQNDANHGHLDSGSFVFDAMGERWFIDIGGDSYNLPDYFGLTRWQYYRTRGEGHNVIVLNAGPENGQIPNSFVSVTDFVDKPRGTYVTYDLSPAYGSSVKTMKRAMMLSSDRSIFTVRDEFELEQPSELWWFAHTQAEITLGEDKKTATLNIGNKELYVKLDSNTDAEFEIYDATPLPGSPNPEGQNKNLGIKKLTVHMKNIKNGYINVSCVPVYIPGTIPSSEEMGESLPIDEWEQSIPDGEIVPVGADHLYVNGEQLPEFETQKRMYKLTYDYGTTQIPQITADAEGYDVFVTQAESMPGRATVKVSTKDGTKEIIYVIEFIVSPKSIDESMQLAEIDPQEITASAVPQPENSPINVHDNDLNTRWAAEGIHWIQYDLGESRDITNIGISWMNGSSRLYAFEVYVSEDGENFSYLISGENTKTSNDIEIYQIPQTHARYIRVKSFGNSVNNWNSMTEFKVYGEK